MATERFFYCEKCDKKENAYKLYDALIDVAEGNFKKCPNCNKIMTLKLKFPFGLEAEHFKGNVLNAFYPEIPKIGNKIINRP